MEEDWFEREILDMVDLLRQAKIWAVYVSYGFGCDLRDIIQADDIPVATDDLANFISDSEDRGIFRLGQADMAIRNDIGRIEFLLCHEHDIHFSGEETPLFRQVRSRWSRKYDRCYESRDPRKWRLISVPNYHGEKF